MVLLLAMIACDVMLPVFAGRLADSVAVSMGGQGPTSEQVQVALIALALLVGTEAFFTLFHYNTDKIWINLAARVMSQLIKDAFYRVQRFSTDWHANNFAGATVRKITRGMWAYDELADTIILGILPSTLIIIGMTVMMSTQWLEMGLFLAVFVMIYITVNYYLASYYLAPVNREYNKRDTKLGATLADSITCNQVVKAFGAEMREDGTLARVSEDWSHHARLSWGRSVRTGLVQQIMRLIMLLGMLSLGLFFWAGTRATPGQITLVLTTFFVISGYLRHVGMHMRNFQKAVNEMEDIVGFMEQPLGVLDRPHAQEFEAGKGVITFDDVTFRYDGQTKPLYQSFSLTVRAGERIALVGHSGSGKSTFVKLIQRLYDINSGAIRIDDQDVSEVTQESLRQAVALVPQEPVLFHRSLQENIAYGRNDATMEEIIDAAKRAHAHDFISNLPGQYETLVGERGIKLSGGERQRIAIARAFLADCPILVLDEATSSLDTHTEALIQESIRELMEGRTTIVIAHRLSTIKSVDRILVFKEGAICEEGTHNELMAKSQSHYRALVHAQAMEMSRTDDTLDLVG